MSLNSAIESIVQILSTQFSPDAAAEKKVFEDTIRSVCAAELAKLSLIPQVISDTNQTPSYRNGYNLYVKQLRASLLLECGTEEAAKAEFNKRGGITGAWVSNEWNKLTNAVKDEWNAKAKLERDGSITSTSTNKRTISSWQRFQGAYSNQLKADQKAGLPVPQFDNIGTRSKACSVAYQLIKDKPNELTAYLEKYN